MRNQCCALLAVFLVAGACGGSTEGGTRAPAPQPTEQALAAPTLAVPSSAPAEPTETATIGSIATSPAIPPNPTTAPADYLASGDTEIMITVDGIERRIIVHVAPAWDPSVGGPVLVALHGGGGAAAQFQRQVGFDAIADREGFVVAYPDGTGNNPDVLHTWNAGDNCCGYALRNDVDDVAFLRAAIVEVVARTGADSNRVSMTGHSNGAMMTYRFAAEAGEMLASAAPVGGAAHDGDVPSEPLPLLHIHSLDDPRAFYEGGTGVAFIGTEEIAHFDVRAGIDAWATANGCAGENDESDRVQGQGDDLGQSYVVLRWTACEAAIEHIVLSGVGHGWPGGSGGALGEDIIGPSTTMIDASEEVWTFVSKY